MGEQKKRMAPPRYDEAFRKGAIRLVVEGNRKPVDVARELGICVDTLKNWLRRSGSMPGDKRNAPERIKELEAENRALRRALAEREENIEILKKSIGIVSKI